MNYDAFWRSFHEDTLARAEAAGLNVEDLYADATARDEEEGE